MARVLCLIIVPVLAYMAIFYVHLIILTKAGSHDLDMSVSFQASLEGNLLYGDVPRGNFHSSIQNDNLVTILGEREREREKSLQSKENQRQRMTFRSKSNAFFSFLGSMYPTKDSLSWIMIR